MIFKGFLLSIVIVVNIYFVVSIRGKNLQNIFDKRVLVNN